MKIMCIRRPALIYVIYNPIDYHDVDYHAEILLNWTLPVIYL